MSRAKSQAQQAAMERAASRASRDVFFLGSALAVFAEAEGLDDAGLSRYLGCRAAQLALLRLCRRPEADLPPERYQAQLGLIAQRFAVKAEPLAQALRQAEFLEAARASAAAAAAAPFARPETTYLLAAQDRDPDADADEEDGNKGELHDDTPHDSGDG